jgi:hypothetical protein
MQARMMAGVEGEIQRSWECKLVQPLKKAVWRFLKKLKIDLPYNPVILFLGTYLKECEPGHDRASCNSTIHNSQALEIAHMPHK